MIILDFSSIAIANVFSQNSRGGISEDMLRHQILNSIRMHHIKYRAKYGKTIIACDGGSWRKDYYPEYKANRKTTREASTLDWANIYEILNKIRDELTEFMPYQVLQVRKAEADDIIATLVETTQEFGSYEPVMIISADKDFLQLQKYNNVDQFSPVTKKLISDKNPERYLAEHIFRGDSGDGVPNVRSADKVFVENGRQTPISSKKIEEWFAAYKNGTIEQILTSDEYRNFIRNSKMIDLAKIPEEITENILTAYREAPLVGNAKVFNYLVSKRCTLLIECAEEFFQH